MNFDTACRMVGASADLAGFWLWILRTGKDPKTLDEFKAAWEEWRELSKG